MRFTKISDRGPRFKESEVVNSLISCPAPLLALDGGHTGVPVFTAVFRINEEQYP